MKILIADDNESVRCGVRTLLSSETTWEVSAEAKDGTEALQKAGELRPDLILLDISMPDLNGLEVASRVRQELPDVKIIIMSQHDHDYLSALAIEAGSHACVDKRLLDTDLLPAIISVVGN